MIHTEEKGSMQFCNEKCSIFCKYFVGAYVHVLTTKHTTIKNIKNTFLSLSKNMKKTFNIYGPK